MKINNKIVIETPSFERINNNNEWDVDEICHTIIKHKHVMIRADLQGSGKTYAAQHVIKLGYRVLFVCPTNKLAQNNGVNGVTINIFLVWRGWSPSGPVGHRPGPRGHPRLVWVGGARGGAPAGAPSGGTLTRRGRCPAGPESALRGAVRAAAG